jgi:hypothetical protein
LNPTTVGLFVFASTFSGALLGMWLRTVLPRHHLDAESRDTVKLGIGLIATMTALVLGLVTASAKSSFDAVDTAVKQTATDVLVLDRVLARYGPESAEVRKSLKDTVGARMAMVWPEGSRVPADLDPLHAGAGSSAEHLSDAVQNLQPHDDSQRALKARAQDKIETILQARWLVLAVSEPSVPVPFLVVLVFWMTITFASFGLFAPRNPTVILVLFVCALSVASAVFLILEMDSPFTGLLRISADPVRYAFSHLNQ